MSNDNIHNTRGTLCSYIINKIMQHGGASSEEELVTGCKAFNGVHYINFYKYLLVIVFMGALLMGLIFMNLLAPIRIVIQNNERGKLDNIFLSP